MSIFKSLAKAAGGLVRQATGGVIRPNFVASSRSTGTKSAMVTSSAGSKNGISCPPGTACDGASVGGLCFGKCNTISSNGSGGGACGCGSARHRAVRMNKSTYVTRGGGTSRWPTQLVVHQKGTECVTVRRRHVTNPKALRRAISRVKGFVKIYRKAAAALGVRHHRRPAGKK